MKNLIMDVMIEKWRENEEYKKTLNKGTRRVLDEYTYSNTYDYLVIDNGWESEAYEMIEFIKQCGIDKFAFNDTSTEGLRILKIFVKNGAVIRKTVKIGEAQEALLIELEKQTRGSD